MERRFTHAPAKVWRAIADPNELSAWWPLRIDELPLEPGATFRFYDGDTVSTGWITSLELGRLLGFVDEDGEHEVRFELHPVENGCLLVFTHSFPAGQPAERHESGWNRCFAALERTLDAGRYQPGPAGDARAEHTGDRWTLTMTREVEHPPAKVWRALTDPVHLREWAPFEIDRSLADEGSFALTMVGVPAAEPMACRVIRAEAPRLLEYTWGNDLLRWELQPTANGTRLTLRHLLEQDGTWAPKIAAGWHICLDVMEHALDGRPIGRIVASEARQFGWERLNAEYAERFGVENTGWPEGIAT
jgi:uncharacterized protein YndB with AHSA1/START domain